MSPPPSKQRIAPPVLAAVAACVQSTPPTICGCLNWQTTGSVAQVSPLFCRHKQMLVRIADRVGETLFREGNELFLNKHYNPAYPVVSLLEDRASHCRVQGGE